MLSELIVRAYLDDKKVVRDVCPAYVNEVAVY